MKPISNQKRHIIAQYAQSPEEQLILARILDKLEIGRQKNIPCASVFLTPREQVLAQGMLHHFDFTNAVFWGGISDAERKICTWVPEYCSSEEWFFGKDAPVCCVRATYAKENTLQHRDFLGTLMGLGIKREATGDIIPGDGQCDVLVLPEIVPFLLQNLLRVQKAHVSVEAIPLSMIEKAQEIVQLQHEFVASMRLDCIIAAAFHISRGKASEGITAGRVSLNYFECTKPDHIICPGDRISLRGQGKVQLISVDGQTKKGRICITLAR